MVKRIAFLVSVIVVLTATTAFGEPTTKEVSQLFPERVGDFRRVDVPRPAETLRLIVDANQLAGEADYLGAKNQRLRVEIARFHQDGEAYSLLSIAASVARQKNAGIEIKREYGTASFVDDNQITFFKGVQFVRVTNLSKVDVGAREALVRALADTIDKGEADIPALIKHLPSPEESLKTAIFLTRFTSLQTLLPNQTVLGAIDTERDADAALVDAGSGKVLVVEFNTPQRAKENDQRVIAKIQELWKTGQTAPTGYRRVGNYSVFVFDAPDDATAKQLMDQVKYEQIVQWLGENPNILKEAERRYVETTLGVFIAVLKASGFALLGCLGLGGLIGALLFSRRRAQQRAQEAFSDAGGMLRLNIDELTPQTDPARLLGPVVIEE